MSKDLETELLKNPIVIPKSSLEEATLSLGGDEAFAFLTNVGATFIADQVGANNIVKAISGPVGEKIIFLARQTYLALERRKQTPEALRKSTFTYIKEGIKEGGENLFLDVAIHDPIYSYLMYELLNQEVPSVIALPASFATGLVVATAGKVGLTKFRGWSEQRSLRKAGMEKEKYYEVRFLLPQEITRSSLEEALSPELQLDYKGELHYHDIYFPCNKEEVKVRLRNRDSLGESKVHSAQIVFTRPGKVSGKLPWNCFPSLKTKFYFSADEELTSDFNGLPAEVIKAVKNYHSGNSLKEVCFSRKLYLTSNSLYFSFDHVKDSSRPFNVMEIKAYPDKLDQLVKATYSIMYHFSRALQTTYGKHDLIKLNGNNSER